MSATRRPNRTAGARNVSQPQDIAPPRARRRDARRRRRLARTDLGLGLVGAIVLVLATPGLAIAALIALLVLVLCGLSFLLERRRRVRAERAGGQPPTALASRRARAPASIARERRRSSR